MSSRPSFDRWFEQVDEYVLSVLGLSVNDLPDCCYRDWYDEGLSASSAAKRAIRLVADGSDK